jgi:hypothetical protein
MRVRALCGATPQLVGEAARSSHGAPNGRRGFVTDDLRCTAISFSNPVRKPEWLAEMGFLCDARPVSGHEFLGREWGGAQNQLF